MVLNDSVTKALQELSDFSYQRRVWLGLGRTLSVGGREDSSLEEAGCRLFVDSGLGHQLSLGAVYSNEIDDGLRELRDMVEKLYNKVNSMAAIESSSMEDVRSKSRKLLLAIAQAS
jgi:hypothetical protein